MTKATLASHNQAPRKVRLVANLVKGKSVDKALAQLTFLPRRAGEPVKKLIESAVANAKQAGKDVQNLTVSSIVVESAGMMKKFRPRAFGRAFPVRRKKSRIKVELSPAAAKAPAGK